MPHVFLSYVREDWSKVKKLHDALTAAGIPVWIDRKSIKAGARWQDSIRIAIREGDFFIVCFSSNYAERDRSYVNEEITIAIEELRQMPTNREWFIPVRLDDCRIPDRSIGAGESLTNIQRVDLIDDWEPGINQIIEVLRKRYAVETILAEKLKFFDAIRSLSGEAAEFPSLDLAFDNTSVVLEMQLDTSFPLTLVNYEALKSANLGPFTFGPGVALQMHNTRVNTMFLLPLTCRVISQDGLITAPAKLSAHVTFFKDNSPFGTMEKIERQVRGGSLIVIRNVGIIGTDFLTDNKLKILLDGDGKRTAILQ